TARTRDPIAIRLTLPEAVDRTITSDPAVHATHPPPSETATRSPSGLNRLTPPPAPRTIHTPSLSPKTTTQAAAPAPPSRHAAPRPGGNAISSTFDPSSADRIASPSTPSVTNLFPRGAHANPVTSSLSQTCSPFAASCSDAPIGTAPSLIRDTSTRPP